MQHHLLTPREWDALAADPEFRALVSAKRRFTVPATIFFLFFFFALPVLVGYEPALMSRPVAGPLTLAFAFALAEFVMAWTLLALYLYRARSFDEAAKRLRERSRTELGA